MTILGHLHAERVFTVKPTGDDPPLYRFREANDGHYETCLTADQVVQLAMELVSLVEPNLDPAVCPVERERLALLCEQVGRKLAFEPDARTGKARRHGRSYGYAAKLCAEAVRSGALPRDLKGESNEQTQTVPPVQELP